MADKGTVACPICHTTLRCGKSIKVRAELCSEVKTLEVPLFEKRENFEDFERSACFNCPECKEKLQLKLNIQVLGVVVAEGMADELRALEGELSEEQVAVLTVLQKVGLLTAFETVVRRLVELGRFNAMPVSIPTYFFSFLRSSVKMTLAPHVLGQFIDEFGGRIQLYKSQGIAMVVSNGAIRAFLPTKVMNPDMAVRQPVRIRGAIVQRDLETLSQWRRTKYGYVPAGSQIFLESLMHQLGDRGREMRPVPFRGKAPK